MKFHTLGLAGFAVVLLIAAFTTVSAADDDKEAKRELTEFKKLWANKKKILNQREAVQHLPEGYEKATKSILNVLASEHWTFRWDAFRLVMAEKNPECIKAYKTAMKKDRRAGVREWLAFALLNNAEVLKDDGAWHWAVSLIGDRKAKLSVKTKARIIRELGRWRGPLPDPNAKKSDESEKKPVHAYHKKAKENVAILVALLGANLSEKKPDRYLQFLIIDSLESLTSQEHGTEIEKWEFWFRELKESDALQPRQKKTFKDELGDVDLEGHSFVRTTRRTENLDCLVLPEFGYSGEYWFPSIFELNKTFNCVFIDLPDPGRMKNLKRPTDRSGKADPNAYFLPLTQLVDAFEKRRSMQKQKKVGIIAHGVLGWVALEYCRMYPEKVAFAIIINTWSGGNSFRRSINQLEGSRDPTFKFFGNSLRYDSSGRGRVGYESLQDDQKYYADIGAYKHLFADPMAIEPALYGRDPGTYRKIPKGGKALVPDFEFRKQVGRKKIDVPVLFIDGAQDARYVKDDAKIYRKSFTNATYAVFENSARTPWQEEPVRFFEEVEKLLEKNGIVTEFEKKKEDK